MDTKLDKISEQINGQGNRLTSIEADLKYHIKRCDRLEDLVSLHQKYFWVAMGAISVAGPVINLVMQYILKIKS